MGQNQIFWQACFKILFFNSLCDTFIVDWFEMKYIIFWTAGKDMKVNLIFTIVISYILSFPPLGILYYEPTIACSPVGVIRVWIDYGVLRILNSASIWDEDCGLRTADCRLSVKCRLQTDSKTQAGGTAEWNPKTTPGENKRNDNNVEVGFFPGTQSLRYQRYPCKGRMPMHVRRM